MFRRHDIADENMTSTGVCCWRAATMAAVVAVVRNNDAA
jgi:hypothetical protein